MPGFHQQYQPRSQHDMHQPVKQPVNHPLHAQVKPGLAVNCTQQVMPLQDLVQHNPVKKPPSAMPRSNPPHLSEERQDKTAGSAASSIANLLYEIALTRTAKRGLRLVRNWLFYFLPTLPRAFAEPSSNGPEQWAAF